MNIIGMPSSENAVKTFDALVAGTNNLFQGSLKEKIFYLHIHKCGGTSIEQAIKSCYRTLNLTKEPQIFQILNAKASFNAIQKIVDQNNFSADTNDYLELKFREELLLYYMAQEQAKYVAGHFSFSETAYQYFSDKYAFVTILREPVARWISLYFWKRYNKGGHRNINTEIIEHLRSKHGYKQGCGYVKLLGGPDKEGDYTSEQAINRAKENLHKFSVVGCLEYQEDFVNQFEKRFNRNLKLRKLNRSPKPKTEQRSIVTEEIKEEIKEICKPDIEIYQYVLNNFVKIKN